jgi:orotate phosphoribosyltransferase
MDQFNSITGNIVLILLAISSIIFIVESLGFLPKRWSDWLNRNKLSQTLRVLQEMGINVDNIRRKNIASGLPNYPGTQSYKESVSRELDSLASGESVEIGHVAPVMFGTYIDLMGATTDEVVAQRFARHLSTYLRECIDNNSIRTPDFDFVVCPKDGSPILSYEFAKIIKKPLALHSPNLKFRAKNKFFKSEFDTQTPPLENSKALVVDDSTTGGRKIVDIIESLRSYGYQVTDCLVVFEPQGKNAREKLKDIGVELHAIVRGPTRLREKQ